MTETDPPVTDAPEAPEEQPAPNLDDEKPAAPAAPETEPEAEEKP
jgi:hypothetical protein